MTDALDPLDQTILAARTEAWQSRQGARVGDKIIMTDGSMRRFAHDYGSELQTTSARQANDQRYYLGHGYCAFSGTLGDLISKSDIADTGLTEPAAVWFFHHDQARAFNAVHAAIPCRVFRQMGAS
jgi:hypothetical protein